MKKIYIYCLKDPNGLIRYIGKTTNIKRRLYGHIYEAKKSKGKRYVLNWIINLINSGLLPIIEVIEICNESNWQEKEIYWIDFYRKIIPNLCNNSDGGLGGSGIKNYSKEEIIRRKSLMSRQFSKFSNEEKLNIWKLIKENKSTEDIKLFYPTYSRQIHFGVKNGRQWNEITNLIKVKGKSKRKGYTYNKGLFIIRKKTNGKSNVLFSSKVEEEVLKYLEMDR